MSFQPNNAFEEQFRHFLLEPETQDAIRGDQAKGIKIMKKIDEFETLHELTGQREQLAVALQDLDAESQRLIYPILRLKMVQHILFAAFKETRKNGTSFVHAVRKPSLIAMLEKVRDELNDDPENAKRIENEWYHNVRCSIELEEKKKPQRERQVSVARRAPVPRPCAALRMRPSTVGARYESRLLEGEEMSSPTCASHRCFLRRRCSPSFKLASSCASTATTSSRRRTSSRPS